MTIDLFVLRSVIYDHRTILMVNVAQLVEPRIVVPVVAGSSPVVHPTTFYKMYIN